MSRPKLLDLFCGAGGCSVGYHRAGFDVVGADGPNAAVIVLALKPAALAFRMRAAAELGAADESEGGGQS